MKAISLWQPFASAVALGSKRVETRHWSTNYRGPLAIHAAKRMVKSEMMDYRRTQHWRAALNSILDEWKIGCDPQWWDVLPFGAVVATCTLVDVRPSESFSHSEIDRVHRADIGGWTERNMGNFGPDRYGWVLDNIKPLKTPESFRGLQGLFNVPDELFLEF